MILQLKIFATANEILQGLMFIHAPRNDVLKLNSLTSLRGVLNDFIVWNNANGDVVIEHPGPIYTDD